MNKKHYTIMFLASILLIISSIFIISGGVLLEKEDREEKIKYTNVKNSFTKLYLDVKNEIPKENVTEKEISKLQKQVLTLSKKYDYDKLMMSTKLENLENYIELKSEVDNCFDGEVLKSNITKEEIKSIETKANNLNDNQKELISNRITILNDQYNQIIEVKEAVDSLFQDDTRSVVIADASYVKYKEVNTLISNLNQKDIAETEKKDLERVKVELDNREAEKKRQREQQLASAWTKLYVPYISQNYNQVYNGCEVASLLMALQYKGYLTNMDLKTFADNVPKSDDPNKGFIYSIYDLEPRDKVHWIAPSALAKYGRDSSGNNNVVDATGYSLDQLENEIMSGNPVVIYLTQSFNYPTTFQGDTPGNLHVLLLTGYNSLTGDHIITDPWTGSNGRTSWQLSKTKLETIYNAVGKKAVVIR